MRYSLVIPVVNDIRVFSTIDSFIATGEAEKYECLVICNGSNKSFIESLKSKYGEYNKIKIIYIPEKNISLARNIGVFCAKGQYLIYIDSDCVIDKNYFEVLHKIHKNQDIINGRIIYDTGTTQFDRLYAWLRSYFSDTLISTLYCPNLIVNKNLYNYYGLYIEELSGSEDTEWSQRITNNKKFTMEYCARLQITHGIDNPKKALKTWKIYGIGQAYRAKKSIYFYGQSTISAMSKAFSELNIIKSEKDIKKVFFIFKYDFFKSIGFYYGWFVKWRRFNKERFSELEKRYNFDEYKKQILSRIQYVK